MPTAILPKTVDPACPYILHQQHYLLPEAQPSPLRFPVLLGVEIQEEGAFCPDSLSPGLPALSYTSLPLLNSLCASMHQEDQKGLEKAPPEWASAIIRHVTDRN